MRKFLVLCVVLILTLISPIYAFADDPEESDSSGDRLATEEELQQLDDELHSTSIAFYNLLSDNGTKATTHDVNDIYNWLNSYFGAGFGSYTTSYPTLAYARLGLIRSELSTMNLNINSLISNSNSIVDYLSSLNPDYATTGISIYDVLHGVLTSLTSIDPNDGDLTIIEALVYITSALDDLHSDLSLIYSSSIGIENKLVSMQSLIMNFRSDVSTYLDSINSSINTGFTNVNANLALMISNLQNLNNNLNTVSWSDGTLVGYYSSESNLLANTTISSSGYVSTLYGRYNIGRPSTYPSNYPIYIHVKLPISKLNSLDKFNFSFYIFSTSLTSISPEYYPVYNKNTVDLYIYLDEASYNLISVNYDFVVSVNNSSYFFNSLYNPQYLLFTDLDFYIFDNYFHNKLQYSILNKFGLLYASDDLIAAKEDQQAYEDQAIEDFTGSGSAAASGQDLGDMKSISGAIKSGLQTGGSVNNALAPFNTNSGFWGWFSQSNYDNINNIPSSGTRSGNNSQPDIIDFYSNNQYTLQGLLSGGGN